MGKLDFRSSSTCCPVYLSGWKADHEVFFPVSPLTSRRSSPVPPFAFSLARNSFPIIITFAPPFTLLGLNLCLQVACRGANSTPSHRSEANLGFMLFDGRLGVCVMARARCIVQFSWAGTLACFFFFTFDVRRANNQTLNGTWHVVTLCLLPSLLLYNPRKRACVRASWPACWNGRLTKRQLRYSGWAELPGPRPVRGNLCIKTWSRCSCWCFH